MRKFLIALGLLSVMGAVFYGVLEVKTADRKLPANGNATQDQATDLAKATELFENGQYEEALEIVHTYKHEMEKLSADGIVWLDLFIKGSAETKDISQLVILFEFFPEVFKEHEMPSLLVADYYITNNQLKSFKKVRSLWEERETQVAKWFVLDVDELLLEGRLAEAVDKLKSRTFKAKADIGRLIRLALLFSEENPLQAWKYLSEAYSKSPKNVDVRMYRAKLLESAHKYNLAHKEYLAATRLDPDNVFLQAQLADYYLRQRQYSAALSILKDHLKPPSVSDIWLKAFFLSRVTKPFAFEWKSTPPPQGNFHELIHFMTNLDENAFWDTEKFAALTDHEMYQKARQETFWLQLLSHLQNKDEAAAFKLLKYNPFIATSWNPDLESALKRVLSYRLQGTLELDDAIVAVDQLKIERPEHLKLPPLFKEIEEYAMAESEDGEKQKLPYDLHNLLVSHEIFSALFLAADWGEAGLLLHELPVIPNDFPEWVAFNVTKALNNNRSKIEALQFAEMQRQTPELTLLTAEMTITAGDKEAALKKLKRLAKFDTDVGFRAAYLASLIEMENADVDKARVTILSQPKLVNSLVGKEMLARIAHLEGNTQLADKLYQGIQKDSAEARSYLAKRAYAEKNWTLAKELTEELLEEYPENALLKENLEDIMAKKAEKEEGVAKGDMASNTLSVEMSQPGEGDSLSSQSPL